MLRTSSPVAPQLPLTGGLAQRQRAACRYHPELRVFQPKMIQDSAVKITPNRLGLSWEHQKTPLSLKKAGGGVQWGCCSEHPNQTSLILILILILNLAFVPYHIPLFPAAGAPNLIGPIKTRESVLTCNSHPSSSFLSPKKTKIGSGISRLCQETYQLLCHDVVVTEGLEQGHEANLTASWGGEDKKARYYFGFLQAATV